MAAPGDPISLYWTCDQVADWIEELGFPQYRACFTTNLITGRKLILADASTLPSLGITDFEHIKFIAKNIRDMLGIEEPYWNRSISLPHRELKGMYLERKSISGMKADALTMSKYQKELRRIEIEKEQNLLKSDKLKR
ncbi:sterile alpha motif domain-containing protein 15-like [Diadema setosum]|uniref:sterile alpha motif domain-containing protein 15-like n=1 Tax=Diadema antillarum TaxID=105358 RepID=UPI003A85B229